MYFKSIAIGMCFLAFPVFAATEIEKKAVYELMEAQEMPYNIKRIAGLTINAQVKNFSQMEMFKPEISAFFNKYLGYDAIKDDLVEIYLRYFTVEEIRQMTAFYRTPVGRKITRNSPFIMKDTMQVLQKKLTDNAEELGLLLSQKAVQTTSRHTGE